MSGLTDPQPAPQNMGAPIVPLVIEDLTARREFGRKKYGDELRVTNGRDALVDAYQEALDLVIYLRQRIEQERSIPATCACGLHGALHPSNVHKDAVGRMWHDQGGHACYGVRVTP